MQYLSPDMVQKLILLVFSFYLLAFKGISQPRANEKIDLELYLDGSPVNIATASITIGGDYLMLLGVFEKTGNTYQQQGADLSISLKDVSGPGGYKIYIAELKWGKSFFAKDVGTVYITEWGNKIKGTFEFKSTSDDGESKMLSGSFNSGEHKVKLKVTTTVDCVEDTKNQVFIPIPYVTFLFEDKSYITNFFGNAYIQVPVGKYYVTVIKPDIDNTAMGILRYAIWKNNKINVATLPSRKGFWSVDEVAVEAADEKRELKLVASCEGEFVSSDDEEGVKYKVLKITRKATLTHLGIKNEISTGMIVFSGDYITTGDFGAVLLEREPGSKRKTKEIILVHPNSVFQFFFYRINGILQRYLNVGGTFSEKIKGLESTETNTSTIPYKKTGKTIISDGNSWGEEDGTIYCWTYDSTKQMTIISVEEGKIHLTPRNNALLPVEIKAGEKIILTADSISSIMKAAPVSNTSFDGLSLDSSASPPAIKVPTNDYRFGALLLAIIATIIGIFVIVAKRVKK